MPVPFRLSWRTFPTCAGGPGIHAPSLVLTFLVPWSPPDIAPIAARALRDAAAALDAEQSPRGLDSLDELALHPILATAFAADSLGVHREQPYPGARGHPIRRERERCDLVLTTCPGLPLLDPVAARVERHAAENNLFAQVLADPPAPPGVACDDALWLELKSVGQFCFTDGIPGPNPTYISDMTACLIDLSKLLRDPIILHAAALTIIFAADERTLRHDAGVTIERALNKGLPILAPAIEFFPIADRIGNAVGGVSVIGLSKATYTA